jgi:zinc resistance-associated protein
MLKPVIAATAVLAIAGSSFVYAQQRFGDHRGFGEWGRHAEHRHRPSAQDMAAFTDARIAALKAGLELTPDQAKNWPAFEQALRDMAQLRVQRMQAREARHEQGQAPQGQTPQAQTPQQALAPTSPFDRLGRRADNMAQTSAALKKVADTGAPLYQSLTDAQKDRFKTLARMLRPHQRMQASNERQGGWRQDGRGFDRDGQRGGQWFGHGQPRFGENDRGPGGDQPGAEQPDGNQGSQL